MPITIKQFLKKIPKATWDGIIEAGKVNPFAAFSLEFFKSLFYSCKDLKEKDRAELAAQFQKTSLDEIIKELESLGITQKDQTETLSRIFKTLGENTSLINGIVPELKDFMTILIDSLPPKIVDIIKDEKKREFYKFEQDYIKAIKIEHGYIDLLGIAHFKKDIDDNFVKEYPIDIAFISLSLSKDQKEKELCSSSSILSQYPRMVIRASAGYGKTTLMKWEATQCSHEPIVLSERKGMIFDEKAGIEGLKSPWGDTIPFVLRFRHWVKKDYDFPEFSEWVALSIPDSPLKNDVPKKWITSVLNNKRALLLFDGLDEFPPERRKEFWIGLKNLIKNYPHIRFRVTSRPLPKEEEKTDQWAIPQNTPIFDIESLTFEKAHELIKKWYDAAIKNSPDPVRAKKKWGNYPNELREKLENDPQYCRIRDLTCNPFLCAAIALIYRDNQELPKHRRDIYEELCIALLKKRQPKKAEETDPLYDQMDQNDLIPLHAYLAWNMMVSGIKKPDSEEYFLEAKTEDFLKWVYGGITYIQNQEVKSKAKEKDLLKHLLVCRGLLREPSLGLIDFPHRSLQEYLAATAVPFLGVMEFLLGKAGDDRWKETIILSAGGLYGIFPYANNLISELIKRGSKKNKICYSLAVACLATAKMVSDEVRILALSKLNEILPPQNSEDAKAISAAGDEAAKELSYEKYKNNAEILVACAETLSLIGSEKAREQLRNGYIERTEFPIVLQLLKCPGIHPLEIPAVIGNAKETHSLSFPEFALEYIRDIKPIPDISNLLFIDLCDCYQIRDISPIEKCVNLKALNLTGCHNITNIESIKVLPELETLNLADCVNISGFSSVSSLKRLKNLDMMNCKNLENPAPLSGLTNLRSLSLRCCDKVNDISPISGLQNLEKLDLGYCIGIKDFSPLNDLPNLKSLDLQGIVLPKDFKLPISIPSEPKPGIDFIEISEGFYIKMVWIDGGEFKRELSKDGSFQRVLLDGYWISAVPVTQIQYKSIIKDNPSHFKGEHNPVECVTWHDAMKFCEILSQKSGREYNLPTEAQWEYACRAGSEGDFCFGESEQRLEHYAWYGEGFERTKHHPVGQKRPNHWGVFDMHGNVWEWCYDRYGKYNEKEIRNPKGPEKGESRMLRGGSFFIEPAYCRSAYRYFIDPDVRFSHLGFRLVLVVRTQ